ncbi:MAG: response regulator [Bryobacteraceae bacterium]|nr:response regulator [Bryobacteraceae bacterium]
MTANPRVSVLLIEDDAAWALLVEEMLAGSANVVDAHAHTLSEGLSWLSRDRFDVALLDLNLPDSAGRDTLARFRAESANVPVIVFSGEHAGDSALQALSVDGQDYLHKDRVDGPLLQRVIRYAVERHRLHQMVEQARSERELQSLERLASPATAVTTQLYANTALKDVNPDAFARFHAAYRELLEQALEERTFQIESTVAARLVTMGEELGRLRASPRDLIEVHMAGMQTATAQAPRARRQAYLEEGRLLILSLVGNLASFYRTHYLASYAGKSQAATQG